MNVLSLFDGMSCGQIALLKAGYKIENYLASEIDKFAMAVTMKNYPSTIQLGNIFTVNPLKLPKIDLVIGGSPCTHWSIANKQREIDTNGIGYKLFKEYVRLLDACQPSYFLYENSFSIHKNIKDQITKDLGVQPILIDSALLSAQQRKRYYWTNIDNVTQPIDQHLYLKDVMEIDSTGPFENRIITLHSNFDVKVRKHEIDLTALKTFLRDHKKLIKKTNKQIAQECNERLTTIEHWFRKDNCFSIPEADIWETLKTVLNIQDGMFDKAITEFELKPNTYDMAKRIYHINGKHPTLTTAIRKNTITDGNKLYQLLPIHCERLQTVPTNFTNGISDRQRIKLLGNGFTVDVVSHILKSIKIKGE